MSSHDRHECGLDRTFCERCSTELEVGQIGLCDSCQDDDDDGKHYELAKENARDNGFTDPMIAFDANDQAASQLGAIQLWI